MHVVFETRFSFFGLSGWKSQAAADPALLFDPARLEERFRYFEMVTLPSLLSQTDPDFRHMVLSSKLMPKRFQRRLRELCNDTLGADRARVMFRAEGSAGKYFRRAVHVAYADDIVAQVVLDDDDAVSHDFVAALRHEGRELANDPYNDRGYAYLSFPRGYTLYLGDTGVEGMEYRFVPFTNLGLSLIAPGNTKRNPFMTSHRKIGQRHPSRMVTNLRPYYLRAVHDHNDSNAHVREDQLTESEMLDSTAYFPFLLDHLTQPAHANKWAAQ